MSPSRIGEGEENWQNFPATHTVETCVSYVKANVVYGR